MRSRRPFASARSMSAASRCAAWESALPLPPVSAPDGAFARCAGFTRPCIGARARGCGFAALGDDIDLVPFFYDLVLAQLELSIGDAFACLHVVFVAVPGADEM